MQSGRKAAFQLSVACCYPSFVGKPALYILSWCAGMQASWAAGQACREGADDAVERRSAVHVVARAVRRFILLRRALRMRLQGSVTTKRGRCSVTGLSTATGPGDSTKRLLEGGGIRSCIDLQ